MANDVAYILLSAGDTRDACQLFRQALRSGDGGDVVEALANFNLGIALAKTAEFTHSLEHLTRAKEKASELTEEDRLMFCLIVAGTNPEGKLAFAEQQDSDLLVAAQRSMEAIQTALR